MVANHNLFINSLQLHELVDVVEEGEDDSEEDVAAALDHANL